ncbi:MAG: FkbM family methyltransferase [Bacteroidota bacterium]
MKTLAKRILQAILGFDNYLVIFSWFKVHTIRWDWKEGDFIHFLNMIPKGGVILDIGANIGIMTVHFSKRFPESKVWAIEPVPENIKGLKRIIQFFGLKNVTISEYALGDTNGEIEMVMPVVQSVKMQGLSHVIDPTIESFNEGERYMVPIFRIDDLAEIKKLYQRITAIKIDAENYEYWVFAGAKETINKHRPIIYCELWENDHRLKCLNLICSLNYEIKVLINQKLETYDSVKHRSLNFFFIPKEGK